MLGMMSVAVVALVLGLALLVFAAALFWRASKQPSARKSAQPAQPPQSPSSPEVEDIRAWGRPVDKRDQAAQSTEPYLPDQPADKVAEPAVESGPEAQPEPAYVPEPAPALQDTPGESAGEADDPADPEPAGEPIPESRQDGSGAVDDSADAVAPTSEASSNGLFAGRRARRQWAQAHGYEYAKEDRYLPGEWPDSLMTLIRADAAAGSATTVARDLVSGFTGGHQFHLAEVNGITVVALRREVFSPVQVHLSDGAAMPAGMRHSELCDRPPYTGYSSDNRALDRMLDSRVDAALHALAGSVSDIAFSTTWVAMKMARRTDPPIWDHVVVQGRALVAASRVLPPRVTSHELDMTNADPTRPRVRGTVDAAVVEEHTGAGEEQETQDEAPAQRAHLRAVPDAVPPETTSGDPAEADASDERDDQVGHTEESRPRMERSSTPVDFPTRSEGQTMGDISGFPDEDDEETVEADPIPVVGEDPDHSRTASGGGPRVIRSAERRSTIFGDGDDVATTSAEVDIIGGAAGPTSRGRHRAPSARHARHAGESGEQTDYPEVDAEVVDPEDN